MANSEQSDTTPEEARKEVERQHGEDASKFLKGRVQWFKWVDARARNFATCEVS